MARGKKQTIETVFGQVLRKFRNEAGISQEKLAMECNLDRTYISMLERGLRQPSLKTIFALAKALNTDPTKIIKKVENVYVS